MTNFIDKLIAEFFKEQFELILTEKSEYYYEGFLKWDEENRERFLKVEQFNKKENEYWYLDENGNRLADNELFAKSPWSILENGTVKKVVNRYLDFNTGKVRFAMVPWFRIGDEYNKPDSKNKN